MDVRLESLFPSPLLHPGVVLQREFLDRYGIPQGDLAKAIGVRPTNLCAVIHRRRSVTLDMGRRLAQALGTGPEYWLLRQLAWDLHHAEPLPHIEPMPQLPEPQLDGARHDKGLDPRRRCGEAKRRPLREFSGWKSAQDGPF